MNKVLKPKSLIDLLAKVDGTIADYSSSINKLMRSLEEAKKDKEMIMTFYAKYDLSTTDIGEDNFSNNSKIEISDFILTMLRKAGPARPPELIKEYARISGKNEELARSNVSNALTRLKANGKVDNRKEGKHSYWFIIE